MRAHSPNAGAPQRRTNGSLKNAQAFIGKETTVIKETVVRYKVCPTIFTMAMNGSQLAGAATGTMTGQLPLKLTWSLPLSTVSMRAHSLDAVQTTKRTNASVPEFGTNVIRAGGSTTSVVINQCQRLAGGTALKTQWSTLFGFLAKATKGRGKLVVT